MFNIKKTLKTKKALLAFLVPSIMLQQAQADEQSEPTVTLETITVNVSGKAKEEVGEKIVNRKELNQQMVQSSADLVRYNTEVDVAYGGGNRSGNKGFAVRGVDGNRVNMNIDGVSLPESESNEIFSPYGYMYEGRFNPDIEMMQSVRIHAGSDSLLNGSGAVGGSVTYNTKDPKSLIRSGNKLGGYVKTGYTNKNEEWMQAVGLAGNFDKWEFLINYAHREGHETKNHDMKKANKAKVDPGYVFSAEEMPDGYNSLIYPNPLNFKRDSAIAKLYYNLNSQHRLGVHGMYQKQTNDINSQSTATYGTRMAHDKEKMESYGASYRFTPENTPWLEMVDVNYTRNKVLGLADTWLYGYNFLSGKIDSDKPTNQEYRPTETTTDQFTVQLKTLPILLNKFGDHTFGMRSSYAKQDYTVSATYLSPTNTHLSYAFPDAKKHNFNLTLTDDIYLSQRLQGSLGLRYDSFRYSPYFQDDVFGFSEKDESIKSCRNSYNNTLFCQRYRKGEGLSKTKFNHLTWSAALNYAIIPEKLTARYKVGTGFLAPTVTQLYSNFEGMGARQVPNYQLKPETSLNQELEFNWNVKDNLLLTAGGYITKYDDFIHTRYWTTPTNGCTDRLTCLQSVNLDDATVHGLKLGVKADLSNALKLGGKLNVFADFHTSKDKAKIVTDKNETVTINTLAAVPRSLILGGDYESVDGKWHVGTRINFSHRKRPNETKMLGIERVTTLGPTPNPKYRPDCSWYEKYYDICSDSETIVSESTSYNEVVETYKRSHLSKSVVLFDIFASRKFGRDNNWILNAGVYNILDEKYIPWETLRQFATINTNNKVDDNEERGQRGYGYNRYTAPGRNYAVALTYQF